MVMLNQLIAMGQRRIGLTGGIASGKSSVGKLLQEKYGLDPTRMTAGGRGEYMPVASNANASGKAANRRTRIVVLPELDQFFQLLNPGTTAEKPAGK